MAEATQNHTIENNIKNDVSKEPQNEYLLIVNKKIRSLNKKLQKAAQIEKKLTEGGKVNEEQQGLLKSKPNTEKQLKDFEKIKKAMLSIHQAEEEKQQGSAQQQQQRDAEAKADATRALVHLIHFAAAFDATTPEGNNTLRNFLAEQDQQRASGNTVKINNESDIHVLISLANAISKRQSGVNSVDHALKYALASQEVYGSGVSYALLREQVAELASSAFFSPQVPVEVHQQQEQPVDEVQPTEELFTFNKKNNKIHKNKSQFQDNNKLTTKKDSRRKATKEKAAISEEEEVVEEEEASTIIITRNTEITKNTETTESTEKTENTKKIVAEEDNEVETDVEIEEVKETKLNPNLLSNNLFQFLLSTTRTFNNNNVRERVVAVAL
eukprot:CAMPEP_0168570068 /NCGR_PEP_ID=MMETSP0413-20121227/16521_1 /TAXON_ID=136452 /ORGANISM="Filamoeba nolandi, Strain NC-AS-23-1" /LENGTH=383 /DNA_ID=CAMNT_0008602661 /DNA_START=93 /DNA_END=1241 /DNA_ORIENTATION=-